jgi:hypothetical protein
MIGMKPALHRLLGLFATCALVAYCAWWALWLCQGKLAPAPFKAITGLPAPTTGYTRSLLCLIHGDLRSALLWNPFSILITALLLTSIGWLAVQLLRRQKLLLPTCFLYAWLAVLALAWAAKLLGDPKCW